MSKQDWASNQSDGLKGRVVGAVRARHPLTFNGAAAQSCSGPKTLLRPLLNDAGLCFALHIPWVIHRFVPMCGNWGVAVSCPTRFHPRIPNDQNYATSNPTLKVWAGCVAGGESHPNNKSTGRNKWIILTNIVIMRDNKWICWGTQSLKCCEGPTNQKKQREMPLFSTFSIPSHDSSSII